MTYEKGLATGAALRLVRRTSEKVLRVLARLPSAFGGRVGLVEDRWRAFFQVDFAWREGWSLGREALW
jgi:hypothetical protein